MKDIIHNYNEAGNIDLFGDLIAEFPETKVIRAKQNHSDISITKIVKIHLSALGLERIPCDAIDFIVGKITVETERIVSRKITRRFVARAILKASEPVNVSPSESELTQKNLRPTP
jgi:hypothetical protein